MPVKSDRWIIEMAREQEMIKPFAESQVRPGISFGTSSYGYHDSSVYSPEFFCLETYLSFVVCNLKFTSKIIIVANTLLHFLL